MAKVNADEGANRLAVINRIFCAFILQAKALLHDIHTQHSLQPYSRSTTPACGAAIEGSNLRLQQRPRRERIDLTEKAITAGLLFLAGVFQFGEGLLHGGIWAMALRLFSQFGSKVTNKSVFP